MAEKKQNFTVDNERKKIYAVVAKLKAKELKVIKNYVALGYTLVAQEEAKKEVNPIFTEDAVKEYLSEAGREAELKEYNKIYNEQAKDKETGELKFKKDGTPKIKGHVATLGWFKKTYPNYEQEMKDKQEKEKKEKQENNN